MKTNIISHYYLPDKAPFMSLSELKGNTDDPVFQDMLHRHQSEEGYNRRYGMSYLDTRREIEGKLRQIFIDRGGKPADTFPSYFVLGESRWFESLNVNHLKLQIELSELPRNSVSITFPDSYIAMTAADKPYFRQVYFVDEIEEMVVKYGMPNDCLLYTSPSPRDRTRYRMPSSA